MAVEAEAAARTVAQAMTEEVADLKRQAQQNETSKQSAQSVQGTESAEIKAVSIEHRRLTQSKKIGQKENIWWPPLFIYLT